MKKILTPIILIALLSSACPKEKVEIISEWILVEQLISPGGPASFQVVNSERKITLLEDNTFSSIGDLCNMGIDIAENSSGLYNATEGFLYPAGCTSSDFKVSYKIENDTLIINYPCIEPCTQKYIPVP